MRGPMPPGGGGESIFERLIPPLRRLPVRWLSAVRGLGRARRRSASTVVGVILATMLIIVSWGFIDSIDVLLDQQFVQIQRYDAELHLAGRPADEVAADVARVDGVSGVEQALTAPVSVTTASGSYTTTLTALEPGSKMHALISTDGSRLPVPAAGVVLGQALESELGIEVGDTVRLEVPGLTTLTDVPVAGFVKEPLGTFVYASLPYVVAAASDTQGVARPQASNPANLIMLTFDEGVKEWRCAPR